MRRILRMFRNSAFVLLACSTPGVCGAAVELGVELLDAFGISNGAAILAVKPGSLADANGLRRNDKIVEIDGKRILSARELQEELRRMVRLKRDTQIVFMRHGGFATVRLEKRPFRARPFIAANSANQQSTQECLRAPTVECLRDHLLTVLKSGSNVSVTDAAAVSREFVRIGRSDLSVEFLHLATDSFLSQSDVLDGYYFVNLAVAHQAAGAPLPPRVLEKASQIAKQTLGLKNIVRGLHITGNTELAEQLLQTALATAQARDKKFTQLHPSLSYTDIASGYALLGKMQSADAIKLDSRFSPEGRFNLELAIAAALVEDRRYEAVPKALDAPLAVYRNTTSFIDSDLFSEAAWRYWQSGNITGTEQIAEYLIARTKVGGAAGVSRRGDIDATVEVLGMLGRVPEALAVIDTLMKDARHTRSAEVDYRLVAGSIRRSGQDELDSKVRPVVDRALAKWKSAYAEATEWPREYERSISDLYRLSMRNGSSLPFAAEMEWQAGASIDEAARKSLSAAIASGVLQGLNAAGRTEIELTWARSALASLKANSRYRGPVTLMAMHMAADGKPDQAIQFAAEVFGEDPQFDVTRDEVRSINMPTLVTARDFDTIAGIYGTLTKPIQRMNILLRVLIPIAGRCDTCTI